MQAINEFKLVTKADAAQVFSVCVKTIDNYIREGLLPQPVQFASKEYWHPEDFRMFLDATFRLPNNDAAGSEASSVAPKSSDKPVKDSSPAVRQRARQQVLLHRLNSGT